MPAEQLVARIAKPAAETRFVFCTSFLLVEARTGCSRIAGEAYSDGAYAEQAIVGNGLGPPVVWRGF
jgi:hypothetical protein